MTTKKSLILLFLPITTILALPAPQAAGVVESGPQITDPPSKLTLPQAQAVIEQEFAQAKSDFARYAAEPEPTTYSLSPEEAAAQSSIDHYFATASFSDVPYETTLPASIREQLTATTGVYALPKPTDPCGPAKQTGEEWDTCTVHADGSPNVDGSPFIWYSDEPAYYGVECLPLPATVVGAPKINMANCNFQRVCDSIQAAEWAKGVWHWNTDGGIGCAVGVWLPDGEGVAQVPDAIRCRDAIYGMSSLYCSAGGIGGDGGASSQVAAVNLVGLPGNGTATGSQKNSGYPSYIIAPQVLG
ncbi:MAG: hypothetical protein Q9219_005663 [cf. Caloplaca sp. 3 TL-2023]